MLNRMFDLIEEYYQQDQAGHEDEKKHARNK